MAKNDVYEELRQVLAAGMTNEIIQRERYREGLELQTDDQVKELFSFLIKEEGRHYLELLQKYQLFGGGADFSYTVTNEDLKDFALCAVQGRNALLIHCQQLERDQQKSYRQAAMLAHDPATQEFLLGLAKEEMKHEALLRGLAEEQQQGEEGPATAAEPPAE